MGNHYRSTKQRKKVAPAPAPAQKPGTPSPVAATANRCERSLLTGPPNLNPSSSTPPSGENISATQLEPAPIEEGAPSEAMSDIDRSNYERFLKFLSM